MEKILVSNKKAFYDYFIIQSWIAGIRLKGSEIKSLRNSQASISEAWVKIQNNEVFLVGCNIPPYTHAQANWATHEPTRIRKLLLHRQEITRISRELQTGMTIVPLSIFLSDRGLAKVKIALVKGKKTYDKREVIKKRDHDRLGSD
jgi:SsrA-binding protein